MTTLDFQLLSKRIQQQTQEYEYYQALIELFNTRYHAHVSMFVQELSPDLEIPKHLLDFVCDGGVLSLEQVRELELLSLEGLTVEMVFHAGIQRIVEITQKDGLSREAINELIDVLIAGKDCTPLVFRTYGLCAYVILTNCHPCDSTVEVMFPRGADKTSLEVGYNSLHDMLRGIHHRNVAETEYQRVKALSRNLELSVD